MSQQIKVFTANELLVALKEHPGEVLGVETKKETKRYVGGVKYLSVFFNIGEFRKREGWFLIENVELSIGVADPNNKNDKRNELEGSRMQLQTSLSKAGDMGQALRLLDAEWKESIRRLVANNSIAMGARKVHELMQFTLSEENKTNPGGVIEDPIIRFKVNFGLFPPKYRYTFLVGKPKTQFYDYTKKYTDTNGKVQYCAATVINSEGKEEPVSEKNLHLFVTNGSVLRSARIMISSGAISQSWISLPIEINRAVIEPGCLAGFSDEDMPTIAEDPAVVAHTITTIDLAGPVDSSKTDISVDEIANLLGDM